MPNLIPRESIHIAPDRQRTTIDPAHINELADSIQENQLFHPVVVAEDGELLAGECRLRAMDQLWEFDQTFYHAGEPVPIGMVPATSLGDLTPAQRAEVELEENIRRQDISWQDRVAAIERVARLKTELALSEGAPPPSAGELSREIYPSATESPGRLSADLSLARNLDKPEVAKAKTKEEAVKALKKLVQREADVKRAEVVGAAWTSDQHVLHHVDCLDWLEAADPEQFDVILTDPPYGMGADTFGDSGGKAAGAHGYEDHPDTVAALIRECPRLFWRVAKPQAHLYLFCDIGWFHTWTNALEEEGWQVFRTPLIWHKPNGMRAPWPEHGPWRRYETVLYAVKGRRKTQCLASDVIAAQSDDNIGHAAQKPVALYGELLRRSVYPGDKVLDPFAGSGVIFPAAESLKVSAVGLEKDAVAYGVALRRLQGEEE